MPKLHPGARLLLTSSNLWNFADGLLGPLFAVYAGQLGGNVLDISWAWAVYMIVTGICVIFVGKLSDHTAKVYVLIAGYALTCLLTFAYMFVSNSFELFMLQAGLGFALALTNPTWYALFHEFIIKDKNDGADWGLADGRDKIARGLATLFGGIIVTVFSFKTLFFIMGMLQLVSTLYLLKLFSVIKTKRK